MKTKITSNILENISRKLQGEDNHINTNIRGKKENILVVFSGSVKGLDEKLDQLKRLKNQGASISLGFSFVGERMLDTNKIIDILKPSKVYREEDLFILQTICREHSLLISPNLTINSLSKVSLGMIDSFVTNLIWTFLYEGKKVYLDFHSVRNFLGLECKNETIKSLVEGHIDTIKNMGAMEICKEDYVNLLDIQVGKKLATSPAETNVREKKLITENDIISLSANTRLLVQKGTIITPLAKDKAKEKKIKIEME